MRQIVDPSRTAWCFRAFQQVFFVPTQQVNAEALSLTPFSLPQTPRRAFGFDVQKQTTAVAMRFGFDVICKHAAFLYKHRFSCHTGKCTRPYPPQKHFQINQTGVLWARASTKKNRQTPACKTPCTLSAGPTTAPTSAPHSAPRSAPRSAPVGAPSERAPGGDL